MPSNTLASYLRFFVAGLTRHEQTGAIVPSQAILIDQMIAPIPADYRGEVLELGAGTGALTLRLATRCHRARIVACEINPELAQHTRKHLTEAGIYGRVKVVADSAQALLRRRSEKSRFIISGIPLGNLSREDVMDLVNSISEALEPGGFYVQFQYSLMDRKKIQAVFRQVRTVPVLLNFPPAFVYYARK